MICIELLSAKICKGSAPCNEGYRSGHNNNENRSERKINATDTEQSSVPGEVSIGGTSIQSQPVRAGDAFAPRQGNSGSRSMRSDGGTSRWYVGLIFSLLMVIAVKIKGYMLKTSIIMTPDGYTERYQFRLRRMPNKVKPKERTIRTIRTRLENMSTISVARCEQSWIQYKLNDEELRNGCKLGFDLYADTCCAGKHAWIESFVEGKMVLVSGFWNSMKVMENLPLANVLYAYDTQEGETLILRVNYSIYLGEHMDGSLLCPNQCRENGIMINTRPKIYCNKVTTETMECPGSGIRVPIRHHGPLSFIPVRRPTMEETLTCDYIDITSEADWEPYGDHSPMHSGISKISSAHPIRQGRVTEDLDHISSLLMGKNLDTIFSRGRLLAEVTSKNGEPDFRSVEAVTARRKDMLSPKDLSKLWRIGVKAARRTLKATSHKCIRTPGNLTRRFKTDREHMWYKKLATWEGSFYVDTLFSKVKSVCGYTCGNLYTTPLGFKNFFPMESKTGQERSNS